MSKESGERHQKRHGHHEGHEKRPKHARITRRALLNTATAMAVGAVTDGPAAAATSPQAAPRERTGDINVECLSSYNWSRGDMRMVRCLRGPLVIGADVHVLDGTFELHPECGLVVQEQRAKLDAQDASARAQGFEDEVDRLQEQRRSMAVEMMRLMGQLNVGEFHRPVDHLSSVLGAAHVWAGTQRGDPQGVAR